MARLPRLTIPGHAHHVIQRGNNGQTIFMDREDHEMLLALLQQYALSTRVAVHAYVLMPNHFHLLVTPETADSLPRLMQSVGRAYVRSFNRKHSRTGTLWEGRYRATVLQEDRYLLPCMAYMDLNPVRAGLCLEPSEYEWSSHGHYIGRRHDRLVAPHPAYWQMGNTPFAREEAYGAAVHAGIPAGDQRELTESAFRGWVLGDPAYVSELQRKTDRRLTKGRAGRPAREK